MHRGQLSNLIRAIGLLKAADGIRYRVMQCKERRANAEFRRTHPDFQVPPDYLMYESFQLNYAKYHAEGLHAARWLRDHLNRHVQLKDLNILDWGCGPGRVIRHLPEVIGNGCSFHGTDYNQRSIAWCTAHLPGISFHRNTLEASLPYLDEHFDIIYGISIFTHLSERMHGEWLQELLRILKPNGILFLTTQGDNFRVKLTPEELRQFDRGNLVVRGNVQEGHRTYSAFHPAPFMHRLFGQARVLEHIQTAPTSKAWLPQDIWIVRKHG